MNNLKSSFMFTSAAGILFIVFIVALQVVYFFVDVNLTQTVSPQKTGMARQLQYKGSINLNIFRQAYPFNPILLPTKATCVSMSIQEIVVLNASVEALQRILNS
jgi:hypothetical protein